MFEIQAVLKSDFKKHLPKYRDGKGRTAWKKAVGVSWAAVFWGGGAPVTAVHATPVLTPLPIACVTEGIHRYCPVLQEVLEDHPELFEKVGKTDRFHVWHLRDAAAA